MLKGSIVALITPFTNNKVDYCKLKELIDYQIQSCTDGVLLLGTTAETSTLSKQECMEIVQFSYDYIKNRMDILVGICTNNTQKAIEECILYENIGIKYFLVITPYYNKSNDIGLYTHFKTIAQNTTSNILIYNIPNRTGVNLDYNIIKELSKIENIVGIKEANENFKESMKLFSLQNNNFKIYCGNDEFILPFLCLGSEGFINVLGNIIPTQYKRIYNHFLNNNYNEALKIFNTYKQLIFNIFLETNPIGIKEAMHRLQLINLELRLPLYPMSINNSNIIKEELENIGKHFNN